jgi:hypothetical protein
MSDVGKRVELTNWPYEGRLKEGARSTIVSESTRYLVVQWDGFAQPRGMRPEEVALIY